MSDLIAFFPSGEMVAFLAAMGFIAAFIDSVVGGGGLISVPTLLAAGLNPVLALGTNKAAAVMGAATGAFTFFRSGKVDMSLMKYLFPAAFFGSIGGVIVLRQIPPDFLRPLVVVLLVVVTLYSVFKKEWGKENTYGGMTPTILRLSILASAVIGFYDGFFGPGAGSFLLFSFLLIGFDFVRAAANARAINFASNLGSVLFFIAIGEVDFSYSIPMGLAMIVGAKCGAVVALKKGASYVRPLFLIVTSVMIGKQIYTLLCG